MKKQRRGFTFLELLIATTLFVVGMVSILQVFPINRKYLRQSAQTTQSVFLAQEKVEILRAESFSDLYVGAMEINTRVSTDTSSPYSNYYRSVTINNIDPNNGYAVTGTNTGIKRIDITINWTEGNINRSYSLSSFTYDHN